MEKSTRGQTPVVPDRAQNAALVWAALRTRVGRVMRCLSAISRR